MYKRQEFTSDVGDALFKQLGRHGVPEKLTLWVDTVEEEISNHGRRASGSKTKVVSGFDRFEFEWRSYGAISVADFLPPVVKTTFPYIREQFFRM